MQAIRLFVDVDSEDIHLPELKQFMGKRVEMIILESPTIQDNKEKKQNMKNFFDAAGKSLRKDWLKAEEDKAWQDL
jgi:hypothetical protein